MRYCTVLLVIAFFLCGNHFCLKGNNVKLDGVVRVTDVTDGVATLELNLSWENSWRDGFNWDAVWVFLKQKPVGKEWGPVYLQDVDYTATNGLKVLKGKDGNNVVGIYVYPQRKGVYPQVSTKLVLKWACGTNYTKESFDNGEIFLLSQAIEMVYIPYGAYYLGDNYSSQSLVPAEKENNIVYQGIYKASSEYNNGCLAENALSISGGFWQSKEQKHEDWWQIDFGRARKLKSLRMNSRTVVLYGYIEGSNTANDGDWDVLWSGGEGCWISGVNSVELLGDKAYRYYRLRMKSNDFCALYQMNMYEEEAEYIVSEEKVRSIMAKDGTGKVTLSAHYPKGVHGFYIMKYEVSQEQYVTFLNTLTQAQQRTLLDGNKLDRLETGNFIFGDPDAASCRNGIVLKSKSLKQPYVFDHDLNRNGVFGETDDGKCIACNYLSIYDLITYASWSGLRPLSELEYEKACRPPYPQKPVKGEYAWNRNTGLTAVTTLHDKGLETESTSENANVNNANRLGQNGGPVRCGIFARSSSDQKMAGSTFWGVMEMGGNVGELVASIANTYYRFTHGKGKYELYTWSSGVTHYGIKGGSFASPDSLLAVSDRTQMNGQITSATQRDSTWGFRLARTMEEGLVTVSPGAIELTSPLCPTIVSTVKETEPASVSGEDELSFSYVWSVKIRGKSGVTDYIVIPGAVGKDLNYSDFTSDKIYQFKRKAICALGEAEVETEQVTSAIATRLMSVSNVETNTCDRKIDLVAEGSDVVYQWQKDGRDIAGAQTNSYTTDGDGLYSCKISGVCGTVYSEPITVSSYVEGDGVLIDPRDGQRYRTRVLADGHEWMVEDLRFGNCDSAMFATYYNGSVQNQLASGYWGVCCPSTIKGAGNWYNWQAAMNAENAIGGGNPSGNTSNNNMIQWRGICPEGWHLPSGGSTGEFPILWNEVGQVVSRIYPACSEFAGKLNGYSSGSGVYVGSGYYWSSTLNTATNAFCLYIATSSIGPSNAMAKTRGIAVRCVKDY